MKNYIKSVNFLTSKTAFSVLIILFIVMETVFAVLMNRLEAECGTSLIPDMKIGLTSEQLSSLFEAYKTDGTIAYGIIRSVDFLFPAVYAIMLSVILNFIYRIKYSEPVNYRWILLTPLFGAIFDYTENITLIILNFSHNLINNYSAIILAVFTSLKFILLGLSIFLAVTGAISNFKGSDSAFLTMNPFRRNKKD